MSAKVTKVGDAKVAYTKAEQSLLRYLQERGEGQLSSLDIVELRYPNKNLRPRFARESVVTMMNALMRKIDENSEKFCIRKSPRAGPRPGYFWIETVAKAPVRRPKSVSRQAV